MFTAATLGCFEDTDKDKPNKTPVADAGPDRVVLSGTPVQFDPSNSTDKDGKIVSYSWTFDDYRTPGEETSADENPVYTYNYPGEYTVVLKIIDNDGESAEDTVVIIVENRPPVVSAGDNVTAYTYEVIYFNGTASDLDGYITAYSWDFDGDGDFDWHASALGSTTHFYSKPGIYQAKFSVTDDFDSSSFAIKNITINELIKKPPIADAGSDQTVPIGQVLFKGSGFDPDGDIELFEWDFDGDGNFDWSSKSTGITKHNYTTEGIYTASLRVTDDSGLTDTDSMIITVDKTMVKYYTSANIYIDWNITIDYLIVTNTTVNQPNLTIIVSDISSNNEEVLNGLDLNLINDTTFSFTSKLNPIPGHAMEIQVLYFETLIGVRVLNIVNQSQELLTPDVDFSAVYTYNQQLTELNRGEAEKIVVTSIGDLTIQQQGGLIYTSMHGTGEYYVLEESESGQSEVNVHSSDLWINTTYSDGKIITQSLSFIGTGTMEADYDDDLQVDIDIKTMRLVRENNIELVNYMYGEGTFSGSGTDPTTGLEGSIAGDVYITNELLGHGTKKNYMGTEYECSIYYTNLTLDGVTGSGMGGIGSVRVRSTIINTTWSVDFEKYDNNTIYYEYEAITKIANIDYDDSGSGYPENHPTLREQVVHISDALSFETPRPRVLIGMDELVLDSKHDVKLKLWVLGEFQIKLGSRNNECVDLKGQIIAGGTGSVLLRLIKSGTFNGVTVETDQDFNWNNEQLKLKQIMKELNAL